MPFNLQLGALRLFHIMLPVRQPGGYLPPSARRALLAGTVRFDGLEMHLNLQFGAPRLF